MELIIGSYILFFLLPFFLLGMLHNKQQGGARSGARGPPRSNAIGVPPSAPGVPSGRAATRTRFGNETCTPGVGRRSSLCVHSASQVPPSTPSTISIAVNYISPSAARSKRPNCYQTLPVGRAAKPAYLSKTAPPQQLEVHVYHIMLSPILALQ